MTDFETVAQAEDRSFAQEELKDLIEEFGAPVYDHSTKAWRFPVSEGEDK